MQEQIPLLTVREVATRLKVEPATVRRWLRSGQLKGLSLGGTTKGVWRVDEAEVQRLLKEKVSA